MAGTSEAAIHDVIAAEYGVDTRSLEFHTVQDQREALARDVQRIRSHPLLPPGIVVGGAIYSVTTGLLDPQEI
jgi:carbonic anhydrase